MAARKRIVRVGLIAYRDAAGAVRRAAHGAVVEVHPDHVARFDRLNVLAGEEPEERNDIADEVGDVDDPKGAEGASPEQEAPVAEQTAPPAEQSVPEAEQPATEAAPDVEPESEAKPRRTPRSKS